MLGRRQKFERSTMPDRYFFNFYENGNPTPDTEGLEMPSLDDAKRQASNALASIFAEHVRANGPNLSAAVKVEDENHRPVFEAEINYSAKAF